MKRLREYERIANKEHWCDRCCNWIHPGEMYEAFVDLHEDRKKNRLVVWKYHSNPSCDYPPDPDWEEKDYDKNLNEENIFKLAA